MPSKNVLAMIPLHQVITNFLSLDKDHPDGVKNGGNVKTRYSTQSMAQNNVDNAPSPKFA